MSQRRRVRWAVSELADELRGLLKVLAILEQNVSPTDRLRSSALRSEAPRTNRRLSDRPRNWAWRNGRRLRGGAAVSQPASGAEGALLAWATRSRSSGTIPTRGAALPRGCSIAILCPCLVSARTTACTTTPCSTFRAKAWTGPSNRFANLVRLPTQLSTRPCRRRVGRSARKAPNGVAVRRRPNPIPAPPP